MLAPSTECGGRRITRGNARRFCRHGERHLRTREREQIVTPEQRPVRRRAHRLLRAHRAAVRTIKTDRPGGWHRRGVGRVARRDGAPRGGILDEQHADRETRLLTTRRVIQHANDDTLRRECRANAAQPDQQHAGAPTQRSVAMPQRSRCTQSANAANAMLWPGRIPDMIRSRRPLASSPHHIGRRTEQHHANANRGLSRLRDNRVQHNHGRRQYK